MHLRQPPLTFDIRCDGSLIVQQTDISELHHFYLVHTSRTPTCSPTSARTWLPPLRSTCNSQATTGNERSPLIRTVFLLYLRIISDPTRAAPTFILYKSWRWMTTGRTEVRNQNSCFSWPYSQCRHIWSSY
jgi:hypothetical protein